MVVGCKWIADIRSSKRQSIGYAFCQGRVRVSFSVFRTVNAMSGALCVCTGNLFFLLDQCCDELILRLELSVTDKGESFVNIIEWHSPSLTVS
jgi:hypothetical protein